MTGPHADIGPELRALAQVILDRLDPKLRSAAAFATDGADGKCQQVWCPVCALAALISGEQHPLLTVVAEHSVALLTVLRAMVDDGPNPHDPNPHDPNPHDPGPHDPGSRGPIPDPPPGDGAQAPPASQPQHGAGRYQPIPVSHEE